MDTEPSNNFPSGLRVMVVDDDTVCLKVVAEMLKRCNYEGIFYKSNQMQICVPFSCLGRVILLASWTHMLLNCVARHYACDAMLCLL